MVTQPVTTGQGLTPGALPPCTLSWVLSSLQSVCREEGADRLEHFTSIPLDPTVGREGTPRPEQKKPQRADPQNPRADRHAGEEMVWELGKSQREWIGEWEGEAEKVRAEKRGKDLSKDGEHGQGPPSLPPDKAWGSISKEEAGEGRRWRGASPAIP